MKSSTSKFRFPRTSDVRRSAPSLEEVIARAVNRLRPVPAFHEVEEALIESGVDLEEAVAATLCNCRPAFAAFAARRELVVNAITTHLPPALRQELDHLLDHLEVRELCHADLSYRLGLALGRRLGGAR